MRNIFLSLLVVLGLSACTETFDIKPEGAMESKTVPLENIDLNRLMLNHHIHLKIATGEQPNLKLTADKNILPYVLVHEFENTLDIRLAQSANVSEAYEIQATLVLPKPLRFAQAYDYSSIAILSPFNADSLEVLLRKHANLSAEVHSKFLKATLDDYSKIKLTGHLNDLSLDLQSGAKADTTQLIIN